MEKKVKPLPKWMLKASKKDKDNSKNTANNIEPIKPGLRRTIYCLSEKELLETAQNLLIQAGREDVLRESENKKRKRHVESEESTDSLDEAQASSPVVRSSSPNLFSDNPSEASDDSTVVNNRAIRKPDLSILDEIFS